MKNNKFIVITLILALSLFLKVDAKNIKGADTKKNQITQLDINTATEEDFLTVGISQGNALKILNYIEITGGFEKIEELKRLSGMGEVTYLKTKKVLKVESEIEKNKLKINDVDQLEYKYFGMTKEELKTVKKYLAKGVRLRSSQDLEKLLTTDRYDEMKDRVTYE